MNHTLQLDFASDCDHSKLSRRLANKHLLQVTLVQEKGPAGGNPLYEFTGRRTDLIDLINEWEPSRREHLITRILPL